jgi:hypothetical protein
MLLCFQSSPGEQQTEAYTVIVNPNGEVVTTFPGE